MQKIKTNYKRETIEEVLKIIGISQNKIGFIYLAAVITKAWEEEAEMQPINYYENMIANEAGVFIGHIYSSIRYAIEEAWFLGNFNIMEYIFGYSIENVVTDAPTPNTFIDNILSVLINLENNNSDICAFFKFIEQGGYTITRACELNYANKS